MGPNSPPPPLALLGEPRWPKEVSVKYERMEVLGKGSFGMVWMAKRVSSAEDGGSDVDGDEYVAIKTINIKDEKGEVYAEREIKILHELRHPHVIRLIRSYHMDNDGENHNNGGGGGGGGCDGEKKKGFPRTRLVVMQLARGPNLHQLVIKRGALGLPLFRQVSRELIAAVSYLHGRAVIHRDIKPSNCILASTTIAHSEEYNWVMDHAIWSSGPDGEEAVRQKKWKLMLVDFGFARAMEKEEIYQQTKKMRNSILFEASGPQPRLSFAAAAAITAKKRGSAAESTGYGGGGGGGEYPGKKPYPTTMQQQQLHTLEEAAAVVAAEDSAAQEAAKRGGDAGSTGSAGGTNDEDSVDIAKLEEMAELAASRMKTPFQPNNELEDAIMGPGQDKRKRPSAVSVQFEELLPEHKELSVRRISTARQKFRSMSALGTKAYAAPEIRKLLRQKTHEDFTKANAAMTECVADYGMIVDAYSVGWTLRVAITGVPPNFSISEYMHQRENAVMIHPGETNPDAGAEFNEPVDICCCLNKSSSSSSSSRSKAFVVKIREPSLIPYDATLLIAQMTEKNPEDRMTVREAQLHPWIAGTEDEEQYFLPQGDVPSNHGDPVVPLDCAPALSKVTVDYHMQ